MKMEDTTAHYIVKVILPNGRKEWVEGVFDTTCPMEYMRGVLLDAALKVWDGISLDLILPRDLDEKQGIPLDHVSKEELRIEGMEEK
jgi:hypothetical protein